MFQIAAWIRTGSPVVRYLFAIVLAILAPDTRIPFHGLPILPLVPYAPFIVVSAITLGFGPGLLTTVLSILDVVLFASPPMGSSAVADAANWERIGVLAFTGVFVSLMAGRIKRSSRQLQEANHKTTAVLESFTDGFVAFDREWRYTYVNPAAAKMMSKTPQELVGAKLWEMWPSAAHSAFGKAFRRSVAENIALQVEAFYPAPLQAWFEVRCYPSTDGLTLFFRNTTERKRRSEQLRFLESAALQTSDGILVVQVSAEDTRDQFPIFVNSAFERITGFRLEDLREEYFVLQLAGLVPDMQGCGAEVRASGPAEQLTRRKDGSEFWSEFTFTPLQDPNGNHTHWVWTLRDITDRKRAEETARLYSAIVESSDDAIMSKALDGTILTWNKGAERIYGYSSEEMVGQSIQRLMPAELAHELPEIVDNLRRGARLEHYRTQRLRKDGARISVALTISPLRNAADYVVGLSIISRDTTEDKRVERALALSEERYRSLAFATSQIVWTTNLEGEVIEDIPLWRAFTGQSPDQVRGMGWIDALHPEDRERTADLWRRAVRNRSYYDTEYRLRKQDGEYRWMAVHGVPVLGADGVIREWVATCADIQDRKQAAEEIHKLNEELEQRVAARTAELEAANRELEAFAYSVSHDLRAPLRAIDGFLRILLEEHTQQLPASAQRYVEIVRNNASQMGALIDDLLAFSRFSRQPLNKQPVFPRELVRQVLQELQEDQQGRQFEIVVGDLPSCEGDPYLLKQVLVNLLSNCFKYTRTREVARIEVGSLTPPGGVVPVYYVRDNGVGFDMRYANKLFAVFQRLHGAQEYPGTGVGLAIVQRIIQRHGGRVWAEAAVNEGATFYFVLAQGAAPQPTTEETRPCPMDP